MQMDPSSSSIRDPRCIARGCAHVSIYLSIPDRVVVVVVVVRASASVAKHASRCVIVIFPTRALLWITRRFEPSRFEIKSRGIRV